MMDRSARPNTINIRNKNKLSSLRHPRLFYNYPLRTTLGLYPPLMSPTYSVTGKINTRLFCKRIHIVHSCPPYGIKLVHWVVSVFDTLQSFLFIVSFDEPFNLHPDTVPSELVNVDISFISFLTMTVH